MGREAHTFIKMVFKAALVLALATLYVADAKDVTCVSGKKRTKVTINDGDSFSFKSQNPYKGRQNCRVNYKLGKSCPSVSVSCSTFNVISGKNDCSRPDFLRVISGGKVVEAFCNGNKPEGALELDSNFSLFFKSNKKKNGQFSCTVACNSDSVTTPPGTPATGATAPPTPTSGSTAAPSTAGPTNAPPTGSTAAPGSIDCQAGCSYTIKFDQSWGQETNYERTADVLVPATSSAKLPVVIDLHGSGGLASTNRLGKFLKNSIIVAGQGYERQWNIVKEKTKAPDTDYVKEVIRQIGEIQQADMDDVTIFGTSNGAGMIYRLLIEVEAPRPFHKVIPAVSTMTDNQYRDGTFYTPSNQNNTDDNVYDQAIVPGKPGPEVHYFHGTADRTVPYEAGKSLGVNFIGAQEATYALAQAFGYEGAQLADAAGVTVQSGVTKYEYSTPDNSVIHYKMTDMGHNAFDALYSDFIQDYIKTVVEG